MEACKIMIAASLVLASGFSSNFKVFIFLLLACELPVIEFRTVDSFCASVRFPSALGSSNAGLVDIVKDTSSDRAKVVFEN